MLNFHYRFYLNYSNLLIHESLLYTSSGIFREIVPEYHCKSLKRKGKNIFFSFKGLRKIRSVWTDTGGYHDDPSETRIRTVEFHGSLSGLGPWRMECKFKSTHYLVWKNLDSFDSPVWWRSQEENTWMLAHRGCVKTCTLGLLCQKLDIIFVV